MSTTFVCYYCGLERRSNERSDEHIIASCIGGNRNGTPTQNVCGACNQFAGDEVDRPFCRDWVIESMRLIAGVSHRGKRPAAFMGQLTWSRPERVRMYLLEGGAQIALFDCTDGTQAIAIIADPDNAELTRTVKNVVDAKFKGLRVINGASPRRAYDDELVEAFSGLGQSLRVSYTIDTLSWHRAIVKMALGLVCQTFGDDFVRSSSADMLRAYLREADPARRDAMGLHGRGGPLVAEPSVTRYLHPGGDEHLFVLTATGPKLGFAANLFGRFENIVLLDESGRFAERLPGLRDDAAKGLAWVVNPSAKTTRGPVPLVDLIRESIRPTSP